MAVAPKVVPGDAGVMRGDGEGERVGAAADSAAPARVAVGKASVLPPSAELPKSSLIAQAPHTCKDEELQSSFPR